MSEYKSSCQQVVYPRNMFMVPIVCGMHGPKTVAQMTGPDGTIYTGRCQTCQAEDPQDKRIYFDQKAAEGERCRRLLEAASIPPLYQGYSFQNFRIVSDNLLHVASRCHELIGGTLLFLTMVGTTGAGKTHLAVACVNEAVERGMSARYVKESEMFGEIKEAFDERGNSDRRVIRKYASYDLLVVDEISKTPHSAYNASALFDIIDDRYTSKRRTVFVGNITSEQMQSHFTDAMLSRMRQKGKAVQVVEADWRNYA